MVLAYINNRNRSAVTGDPVIAASVGGQQVICCNFKQFTSGVMVTRLTHCCEGFARGDGNLVRC
jgi:hypothetical protein